MQGVAGQATPNSVLHVACSPLNLGLSRDPPRLPLGPSFVHGPCVGLAKRVAICPTKLGRVAPSLEHFSHVDLPPPLPCRRLRLPNGSCVGCCGNPHSKTTAELVPFPHLPNLPSVCCHASPRRENGGQQPCVPQCCGAKEAKQAVHRGKLGLNAIQHSHSQSVHALGQRKRTVSPPQRLGLRLLSELRRSLDRSCRCGAERGWGWGCLHSPGNGRCRKRKRRPQRRSCKAFLCNATVAIRTITMRRRAKPSARRLSPTPRIYLPCAHTCTGRGSPLYCQGGRHPLGGPSRSHLWSGLQLA